jgi:two-component system, NtrC family, C4-dicarboxylate transport response regulator DctD
MATIGEIFLVDDEVEILDACRQTFELEGYAIKTFRSGREVLPLLKSDWLGVVITDVRMPEMDGLTLLGKIRENNPDIPVVILTGHGDVPMAIEAMRAGAYDFLEKPAPPEYLLDVASRALKTRQLFLENCSLKQQLSTTRDLESRILGDSEQMVQLRRTLSSLATVDVDVLLIGETGVGKELAAQALHHSGTRASGNFVALNCGAIPSHLVESELFGHEKGAFTSASERRIGKIEMAHGGTLFLDEIESMPLEIQIKLLRALQERAIERVGGNRLISVDFRVIAAAKIDLRDAARQGLFREDLFYRLNVARVPISPLRERKGDIPILLQYFMQLLSEKYHRSLPDLDSVTLNQLQDYSWPGNVRELKNVVQQLLLGLPLDLSGEKKTVPESNLVSAEGLDEQVCQYEKKLIAEALKRNRGRVGKTAEDLNIPRKKLYLRMQKYQIEAEE